MKKTSGILLLIGGLALALSIGFTGWLVTESVIEVTSGADFCQICHPMEPMVKSYFESAHGGKNDLGIVATCTDCHVSHETPLAHIAGKAESGIHDFWVMYTQDTDAIDWLAKRQRREEFVFDSGCVTCHNNLERATRNNNKAFVAHKPYFLGETSDSCVSCHEHVGHSELSSYLNP